MTLPFIQSINPEFLISIVGTPWDPTLGREARVLDYEPLTATEPMVPGTNSLNRENEKQFWRRSYIRRDTGLQLYGYTDGCLGCNAASEGRVAKPDSLECRKQIESAILSEESDEIRKRYKESQRRRDAPGVPLEPRPGLVGELPPSEGAGELALSPRSETIVEEVSVSTDLPMRIAVEKRTVEVTESDRQAKWSNTDVSELVDELMHLEAALGPRLRDGCQNVKIGKSWKSHGGGAIDSEHHDECHPEHPDDSKGAKIGK